MLVVYIFHQWALNPKTYIQPETIRRFLWTPNRQTKNTLSTNKTLGLAFTPAVVGVSRKMLESQKSFASHFRFRLVVGPCAKDFYHLQRAKFTGRIFVLTRRQSSRTTPNETWLELCWSNSLRDLENHGYFNTTLSLSFPVYSTYHLYSFDCFVFTLRYTTSELNWKAEKQLWACASVFTSQSTVNMSVVFNSFAMHSRRVLPNFFGFVVNRTWKSTGNTFTRLIVRHKQVDWDCVCSFH